MKTKTVRVYFFKPSRKFGYVEEICMSDDIDTSIKRIIRNSLLLDEGSRLRYEGMTGFVPDHCPPIMFLVDRLKDDDYLEDWVY